MSKNVFRNFKSEDTAKKVLDLVASDIDFYENFEIVFPNEYDKAHLGQVFAVTDSTDDKLITVFPKRHDSSTFTDVQESVEDMFPNNPTFILFDITPSVGWDIEYGTIERLERSTETNDKQPKDLGDRMADAIKRDIESYDSSEDKFQGIIGDMVNKPSHYTFSDKFEIIDVVEEITKQYPPHLAFAIGNAVKYIARSQHKNGKQDIEKSIWYLQRVLDKYDKE